MPLPGQLVSILVNLYTKGDQLVPWHECLRRILVTTSLLFQWQWVKSVKRKPATGKKRTNSAYNLTSQTKLTLTVSLTLTDTVTVIFYAEFLRFLLVADLRFMLFTRCRIRPLS